MVVETAARLTALGADVLKAEFPYDAAVTDETRWAEACAELDAATPRAVGAAVRRRRRRDVRAPGRGRLPGGRERRARGAIGVGRGGDAGRPGARTPFLAGAGRDRLAPARRARGRPRRVPWRPRWTAARAPEPPGPGWYAAVLSPPRRCATSTCSSSASSTRTSSSRTRTRARRSARPSGSSRTSGSRSAARRRSRPAGQPGSGLRVAMVGVVGDDPLGPVRARGARARGASTSRGCRVAPGRPTGRVGDPRQRHRPRDPHGAGHDRGHASERRARRAARSRAARARRQPVPPARARGGRPRPVPGGAGRRRDDEPRPQLGPVRGVGRRVRRGRWRRATWCSRTPARRVRLTGAADAETAARTLAGDARIAVVKLGADGRARRRTRTARSSVRPPARSTRSTPPAPATRSMPGSSPRGWTAVRWMMRSPSRSPAGRCRRGRRAARTARRPATRSRPGSGRVRHAR